MKIQLYFLIFFSFSLVKSAEIDFSEDAYKKYKWRYGCVCSKKEFEENTKNFISSIKNNDIENARKFLNAGADIDAKDDDGWTALMYSAHYDYEESLLFLIKNEAGLNIKAENGMTSLMYAAIKGNISAAKILVNEKADINILDRNGWSALDHASYNDHKEIVQLLSNDNLKCCQCVIL